MHRISDPILTGTIINLLLGFDTHTATVTIFLALQLRWLLLFSNQTVNPLIQPYCHTIHTWNHRLIRRDVSKAHLCKAAETDVVGKQGFTDITPTPGYWRLVGKVCAACTPSAAVLNIWNGVRNDMVKTWVPPVLHLYPESLHNKQNSWQI